MKYLIGLIAIVRGVVGISSAATIGIHGIQHMDNPQQLKDWETRNKGTIDIIGLIFDHYGTAESSYLHKVVAQLGDQRIYHISLSPFGYSAKQVYQGAFDREYRKLFKDIQSLGIQVVFRTMHEMNGGRYSRASQPADFRKAWRYVYQMARSEFDLQSDKLLFSLSFNSQDLPTSDPLPSQQSSYEYCSQWRIDHKGRCPRMLDYYPGSNYVDLIGVTLYNRGRSRSDSWSQRKDPEVLLNEDNLYKRLASFGKPIIIDELGSTAVKYSGPWSSAKTQQEIRTDTSSKNIRLRTRKELFSRYPLLVGLVYFNVDHTDAGEHQILGEADRKIILSSHIADYSAAPRFLLRYGDDSLKKLFVPSLTK